METWDQRLFARIEQGLLPLFAILLGFTTIGVFIQVLMRYFFAKSFLFGEELSLFAFIWCCFLGTAVVSMRRTHFSFDAFEGKLSPRGMSIQSLIINICMAIVTLVMVVEGWHFSMVSIQRLSPALGISLFLPTLVIPMSGAIMLLVNIIDIIRACRGILTGKAEAIHKATSTGSVE